MSAETSAEHLARLRATYGDRWRIDRAPAIIERGSGPSGSGALRWTAQARDGSRHLTADSPSALENEILRHTHPGGKS